MAATASILIEVDDSGAVAAFKAINAEGAKMGPALAPVKPALDNITKGSREARESAALLSEELGLKVPRGLRNILAESSVASTALRAAFSAAVVGGFITVVKDAVDNLTGFSAQLDVIKKQGEEVINSVAQANKTLLGPQNLQQVNAKILETTKSIESLNQQLGLTGNALGDAMTRGLTKFKPGASVIVDTLDRQKTLLNELFVEQAKLTDEQRRTEPIEILKQQNAAREAGLTGLKAITTAYEDQIKVIQKEIALGTQSVADHRAQYAEIAALKKKEAADVVRYFESVDDTSRSLAQQAWQAWRSGTELIKEQQKDAIDNQETLLHRGLINQQVFEDRKKSIISASEAQIYKLQIQQANEVTAADSQAAVASVAPWARAYAQISADTQARLREIQQQLDNSAVTSEQAARLAADAWQVNFARTRDQLAQDMESFFDDLTSGNIGRRFKKMFEDMVFQMVATWLLGMNQMRNAAQVGFGGGPGGILGAIFGGSGASGIGPGGTPPFLSNLFGGGASGVPSASIDDLSSLGLVSGLGGFGDSGLSSIAGIGISAGQGAPAGATLPSGAALGTASGLAGILTKIFPHGLSIGGLNLSGSLLASGGLALALNGIGRGGPLGAIEGAVGGGLAGFAIGGPIGAAIGWVVGLFSSILGGLFGPHKGDTARIQVMEPLLAGIKQVVDSYDVFQTDYNTGVSELETLRSNALAALKKIGGRQVSGNSTATNQRIDAAEKHLKDTEAERQRRAQLNFGAPQFHEGGFVHPALAGAASPAFRAGAMRFATGGEVPAILHSGEFVMKESAVQKWGLGTLSAMNSGSGGGGGDHFEINIVAADAKSFKQMLSDDNTAREVVRSMRRLARRGYTHWRDAGG